MSSSPGQVCSISSRRANLCAGGCVCRAERGGGTAGYHIIGDGSLPPSLLLPRSLNPSSKSSSNLTVATFTPLANPEIGEKLSEIGGRLDYPLLSKEFVQDVRKLWEYPAIQETYSRGSILQVPDCAQYFMENLDRLAEADYVRTKTLRRRRRRRSGGARGQRRRGKGRAGGGVQFRPAHAQFRRGGTKGAGGMGAAAAAAAAEMRHAMGRGRRAEARRRRRRRG